MLVQTKKFSLSISGANLHKLYVMPYLMNDLISTN